MAAVEPYLDHCDLVLVMSVMPGFGGQTFEPAALEKLRHLRAAAGADMLLSVNGGVQTDNIGLCAEAGADILVAGTALFSQPDYRRTITEWTDRPDRSRPLGKAMPENSVLPARATLPC